MSSFVTAANVLAAETGKAAAATNTRKMTDAGMLPPKPLLIGGVAHVATSKAEADKLEKISRSERRAKGLCDNNAMANMLEGALKGAVAGTAICAPSGNPRIAATCAAAGAATSSYQARLKSEIECLDIRNKVVKKD